MTIREIYKNSEQFLNKEVKLGGWIRSIRGSKHFGFLVLHDGTFFKPIQVVYEEKLENFQEISKMNVGAAVIVEERWFQLRRQSSHLRFRQLPLL